jgi:hypothetical protein
MYYTFTCENESDLIKVRKAFGEMVDFESIPNEAVISTSLSIRDLLALLNTIDGCKVPKRSIRRVEDNYIKDNYYIEE